MSFRKLTSELQEVAIKELNEDPRRTEKDLEYIREWLSQQSHIKARTDDQFLIAFLRGTKFSLQRTKEKLDMYYTFKTITPDIFKNRDPFDPDIQRILSLGLLLPLPNLPDPSGPRYSLMRNELMEKHSIDQPTLFKVFTMFQDIILLEDDNLGVSGVTMIQDMGHMSLSFFMSMPLSLLKKSMMIFQNGYPHRIKGTHVVNSGKIFDAMFTIVKPFMTEKFKRRISVYSSLEDLYKTIPREVLPEEYGGQGGTIDEIRTFWKAKIESYREWFKEDEVYGTDEKKRSGKPKTSESVFGVDGSFRQLSVD